MTTVSNIAIGAHLAGNAAANTEGMASRIMDTDFAKSSANLAKFTVLNQSPWHGCSQIVYTNQY